MYEMVTGKRAFEGQSAASVIAAILEREPPALAEAPPLDRVIRRSLAKDPDQRFQTARDLKAAFLWAMQQPPAATPAKPNRALWVAVAAAMLAAGALAEWTVSRMRRTPADDRVFRVEINPPHDGRFVPSITNAGGFAISPDGKMVAFVASANGKTALWVRNLDNSSSARLLPGTENAGFPFWSPDSKSIGFAAGAKLRQVGVEGGGSATICDVPVIRGASWGSDGYILFAAPGGLYRVSASGATPSPLTTLDASRGESAHRWPQVLPGGRFLYTVYASKPGNGGVYAASLTRPAERVKLLATDSNVVYAPEADDKGYLLWLRGGALVTQEFNPVKLQFSGEPQPIAGAVKASNQGLMQLAVSANGLLLYGAFGDLTQFAWFDRTGKVLKELGEPVDSNFTYRLSPDTRHIAVQRITGGLSDLWLMDTERGLASRFTAETAHPTSPLWSPDGRTILFTHFGSKDLLRKAANGTGDEEVVTHRPNNVFPIDWSGDGQWVLTREFAPDTGGDLWILPVTPDGRMREGAQPKPYLRTRFFEDHGRFSPEPSPRHVAYQSDESGRYEVYIDAFPSPRGKRRISTGGGRFPQWGAGGRELFYISPELKLMAVNLKVGPDSVEPSAPHELFQLPVFNGSAVSPYEATPDGQRFLVLTSPEPESQALTLIVNWPTLLRKTVPIP
jgi:Tol biopolymer transport system component